MERNCVPDRVFGKSSPRWCAAGALTGEVSHGKRRQGMAVCSGRRMRSGTHVLHKLPGSLAGACLELLGAHSGHVESAQGRLTLCHSQPL